MSHPMYNPRGGPFSSGQRTVVTGQYGLGSQSGLDLGGARLGPDSMPGSRGGMMVNQQMSFSLGQRQTQVSQNRESTLDMSIREAREEVHLLTQMLQQPKQPQQPRLPKDLLDDVLSSGSGGYTNTNVLGMTDDVDWSSYKAPTKLFASQRMSHSSSSSQLFQTSSFGGGGPSGLDSQAHPECKPTRYTSESASSILASFGLSSEDLELLSHYPDDQLTPDNLPFILRDIRIRKVKRSDTDLRSSSDLLSSESRHSKVIDYGHSSKFGYPDDKPEPSYAHDRLAKETSKYGRDVSDSPYGGVDVTKRQHKNPVAQVPDKMVLVPKLQQTSLLDSRPATQSLGVQGIKRVPGKLSTTASTPPSISRPSLLGPGSMPPVMPLVPSSPELSWTAAYPAAPGTSTSTSTKRLPTPTMMNDYSAATPRIFPHTCSLCNVECTKIKDWIEHQNTNLHIESCRRLRKQYPDWKSESVTVSRTELKLQRHSPKHRTRSHSYSRSPSPKRHHGSSSRRQRSRSQSPSRSPRRYRRSRSRSRSRSPQRKTRASSPSYRHRSRTPPRRRSRSPGYSSSSRSFRRESPRRSSPARQQRSSSSERLAKKIIESSAQLSSASSSSTLKAVVQSLAPALLAELAKKRNTSSSSLLKSSSSIRRRSSSPSSKRRESSKSSSSSLTKTGSSKSEKPKKPLEPEISYMLRLTKIPFAVSHQQLVTALEVHGKVHTAVLLKKINEASVRMEREEDAKALANAKYLKLHGVTVPVSWGKDGKDDPSKSGSKAKEMTTTKTTQPTKGSTPQVAKSAQPPKAKAVMEKTLHASKVKETSNLLQAAKGKPLIKTKPPTKAAGDTPALTKIVKKEIPWRRNIVEITDLPENGVTEDELANLAKPHGFVSTPVIAVTQQKAYLEMPDSAAAEEFVKAYTETPAKLQEKEIKIKLMKQPIDLNYTESLFRVLMGMEKLHPQEMATLPERLLTVSNIPSGSAALREVENLIKRFGSYKQALHLNGRIIFEMDTAAIARTVYSRFLKFPCIIQNNSIIFKLAKLPKVIEQVKKKADPKGVKQGNKIGNKAPVRAKHIKAQARNIDAHKCVTSTEANGGGCATAVTEELVSAKARDSSQEVLENEAKTEIETSTSTQESSTVVKVSGDDSEKDPFNIPTLLFKTLDDDKIKTDTCQMENITMVETEESESVQNLPPVTNEMFSPLDTSEKTEETPMDTAECAENAPVDTTECAEKTPLHLLECSDTFPLDTSESDTKVPLCTTESTENAPLGTTESTENAPLGTTESTENAPLGTTESTENAPLRTTESTENAPLGTPESAENAPLATEESAKKVPLGTPELAENVPLGTPESTGIAQLDTSKCAEKVLVDTQKDPKNTPMDASDQTQKSPMDVNEKTSQGSLPQAEASEVHLKRDEEEMTPLEDISEKSPSVRESGVDPINDSGKGSFIPSHLILETVAQNDPMQICDQSQLSESAKLQTEPPPFDTMLDFPPVTQEILKALEAAVHQCRLQSSLRRAEEEARQNAEAEKLVTEKQVDKQVTVKSTSKSVMQTANKPPQGAKKSVPVDIQKTQTEKREKPQNSRSSSQQRDSESPEMGASTKQKGKIGLGTWDLSTTKHGGSSHPSTCRMRSDTSPSSKMSAECMEEEHKSYSEYRNAHRSRSESKTRKMEKRQEVEEEEDFEEPFPFNLDEFVTVDEVGDDVEEHSTPSSEPSSGTSEGNIESESFSPCSVSNSNTRSKQVKKPSPSSTPCRTRSSAVAVIESQEATDVSDMTEKEPVDMKLVTEEKVPEEKKLDESQVAESDAVTSDNLLETFESASDEVAEAEFLPTEKLTLEPPSEEKEKKSSAEEETEEPSVEKEATEPEHTDLLDPNQFDSSVPEIQDETPSVSELKESETPVENESSELDTLAHETKSPQEVQNKASTVQELPSQDAMVTLDEVIAEEEDFPDEAEEEELLKRQADENPEALLTVDEVGGDEAETEEEQLEKQLHGLVTLDEIVEEEDDDSFNPEALVTLDEARGDEEEMDTREQDKDGHASCETETPTKPEELFGSPRIEEEPCVIEELRQMDFVTVDEVGEEEGEKQEKQGLEEKDEVKAPATRKGGKLRKRARQTPVRKSTRGKKRKTSDESEEAPQICEEEKPEESSVTSSVPELVDKELKTEMPAQKAEPPADISNTESSVYETEKKPSASTRESDVEKKENRSPSPGTEKTDASESKQRQDEELNQEPQPKKPCTQISSPEDFTLPPFNPDNPIGLDFVVPKTGFFCRLCSLFYGSEETAKKVHCGSLRHYQNMQKYYEKLNSQSGSSTKPSSSQVSESK